MNVDRRHRGRAVRRERRLSGPTASVAFVDVDPQIRWFVAALNRIIQADRDARPHLIHNGRKPR